MAGTSVALAAMAVTTVTFCVSAQLQDAKALGIGRGGRWHWRM
jgi:hypothetical protein